MNKTALIFTIWNGIRYMAGFKVLYKSILEYNPQIHDYVDFVLMITKDVDITMLGLPNINVILVPYIIRKSRNLCWRDFKYTALNCLQLESYDKVVILDCDILCLGDISEIINLEPPASIFYNNPDKQLSWKYIQDSINDDLAILGNGIFILKPRDFTKFISIKNTITKKSNIECEDWIFKKCVLHTFPITWNNIDNTMFSTYWNKNANTRLLHFVKSEKPWVSNNYPDQQLWRDKAAQYCIKYSLSKNKRLYIENSKLYISNNIEECL